MFEKKIREIPLNSEIEKRHLSLVVGVLVFLVVVILSITFSISGSFFSFQSAQTNRLTIKIPIKNLEYVTNSLEHNKDEHQDNQPTIQNSTDDKQHQKQHISFDDIYQKVMDVLKKTPTIVRFDKIDHQDFSSSLKYWASNSNVIETEHVSIDVEFLSGKTFCLDDFIKSLQDVHPKIMVDYNENLQAVFHLLSISLRIFSILLVSIVTFCILLLVTLVTRASLKTHFPIIDILRLLGAKNSYIVNVYQFQVFKSILIGSIFGSFISFPLLYVVKYSIDYFGFYFFSFNILTIENLKIFLIVPFFMAIISFVVTRIVVTKELKKLFSTY